MDTNIKSSDCLKIITDFYSFLYEETKENDIDFISNKLDTNLNLYYNQNLYSYWIFSSHNTYLPYGQVFGQCDTIYYKLQSFLLSGGCLEIDVISVNNTHDDILVYHLITNDNYIKLSEIFKVVANAVEEKEKRNILSGPIIITIDNKNLTSLEEYKVFLKIAKKEFYSKNILFEINDSFDLRQVPISTISSKVIIRWGGLTKITEIVKNNIDTKNEKNTTSDKEPDISGQSDSIKLYELSELFDLNDNLDNDTNISNTTNSIVDNNLNSEVSFCDKNWIHLKKCNIIDNFEKEILLQNNISFSKSANFSDQTDNINLNTIINSQRNMMKIYPHCLRIMSGNYYNIEHFRNGIQLVSINIQTITDSWYINNSIFLPSTGRPCTLNEFIKNENDDCRWVNSLNNTKPSAYILKPPWLLGLTTYPELYNLKLTLKSIQKINKNIVENNNFTDYKNLKITCSLTNNTYEIDGINKSITISDIDVTTPIFIFELYKYNSVYKTGHFINWNISNLNGTIVFDINKIKKTSMNYNDINISTEKERNNSSLYEPYKQIRITLDFEWTKSSSQKNMDHILKTKCLNNKIDSLRSNKQYALKSIQDFLEDINLLNKYQDDLKNL